MMSYHLKRARIDTTQEPAVSAADHHNNGSNGSAGNVVNHRDKLLQHIRELYLREDYSDVEFVFGPDVIHAHKLVLSVNSKWRQLLRGQSSVDMEDTPLVAFKEVLRYLYNGRLDLDDYEPAALSEIRQLAERFDLWDLCRPIEDLEDVKINAENCLQVYSETTVTSPTGQQCLAYIGRNAQDVLYGDDFFDLDVDHAVAVFERNDLSVTEQTVFEAVRRYVTGEGKGDKKRVVSAVRLSLLPFDYLWTTVRKFAEETKLLSIDDLSLVSAAKARLTEYKPDIRERAHCLPNATDVVALRAKTALSTRVLKGKVGDVGEEANAVELDLGLPYVLTGMGVMLSSSGKTRYAFKLETSMDRKDWQMLYDFTKYHTSNKLDLMFNPLVARYVRLSDAVSYPDWAEKRKDSKPVRKITNLVAVYEEPQGVVQLRDHLLASKYLLRDLACDFTYTSWHKKAGKTYYVSALNDPIICILSQPVWMDTISLFVPDDEPEKEWNFTVEVTADPDVDFKTAKVVESGGGGGSTRGAKGGVKKVAKGGNGWQMVGDFREEARKGDVEVAFEPTIVNAFRLTATRLSGGTYKGKERDFAVEIRI